MNLSATLQMLRTSIPWDNITLVSVHSLICDDNGVGWLYVVVDKSDRGRTTRGAFPRMPLKLVEELAGVIQDAGHGERARTVTVLAKLDRKPTSSATQILLTSANRGYGLVIGAANDTHLSLTERGTALVSATDDYGRYAAAFEALQHNEIFRAFIDKFKHRPMPSNEVAIDHVKDQFDLSESDATAAVRIIVQNMHDYGLTENVGGREVVNPPDEVLDLLRPTSSGVSSLDENEQESPEPKGTEKRDPVAPLQQSSTELANEIIPQIAFNIQIQLPSDATPETYDAIFRSIAAHLLRRATD